MGFKDAEWAYTLPLPLTQTAVLAAVCHRTSDRTHKTTVKQQTIATMLGCDRATVLRTLGILEAAGLIVRTPRDRSNGSKTSDTITVCVTESNVAESNVTESNVAENRDLGDSESHPVRDKSLTRSNPDQREGAATRGTRIPEPFILTADMRHWAATEAPAVDVDLATRMFVDHFRASTGRNATKLDWLATWRNWIRRDQQTAARRPQRLNDTERVQNAAQIGARLAARPQELTA